MDMNDEEWAKQVLDRVWQRKMKLKERKERPSRLESAWMAEITAAFPDVKFGRWGGKERGQARTLVEKYDVHLVEVGFRYLIREWSAINKRIFKGSATVPTLSILLKLHDTLMPEAQLWSKSAPSSKSAQD